MAGVEGEPSISLSHESHKVYSGYPKESQDGPTRLDNHYWSKCYMFAFSLSLGMYSCIGNFDT
jgi:hypothetical protein